MLGIYGYLTSWAIYLAAGTLCFVLFYRATRSLRPNVLANVLRAIFAALIYTPWYVASDQDLMAPALMVVALDVITLQEEAAFVRALVPLTLAIIVAVLVALFTGLFRGLRRK